MQVGRVVFVHGLGAHTAGWSAPWRAALQQYWPVHDRTFSEVVWARPRSRSFGAPSPARGAEVTGLQRQIQESLAQHTESERVNPALPARGRPMAAWNNIGSDVRDVAAMLADGRRWASMKGAVSGTLRPLLREGAGVAVVAHSWGTVLAYEALHALAMELPEARVPLLVTVGSPLWIPVIRGLLRPSPSRPRTLEWWLNLSSPGDVVGGWLYPFFPIDRDHAVPPGPGAHPHSAYFQPDNAAVWQDLLVPALQR
jgi:hypothetical protein